MTEIKEEESKEEVKKLKSFFDFTINELDKKAMVKFGDIIEIQSEDKSLKMGFSWSQVIRTVNLAAEENIIGWDTVLRDAFPYITQVFQM